MHTDFITQPMHQIHTQTLCWERLPNTIILKMTFPSLCAKKGNSTEGFLLVLGCNSKKKRKNREGRGFEGERKGVRVLIFFKNGRQNNIGFGSNLT